MRRMDTMGRGERVKSVGVRVVERTGLYSVESSGWTSDDERALMLGAHPVKRDVLSSHCILLDSSRLRSHRG